MISGINDFSAALIEACSNAIEHGNKLAKNKTVRVSVRMNGQRLVARVHDQGEGFDFQKYLSKTSPPDPLSERGRGILIMQAFTDEVRYSREPGGGICLELIKQCDSDGAGAAKEE